MKLLHPWLLLLFLLFIPLIVNYIRRKKNSEPTIEVSSLRALVGHHNTWRTKLMTICFVLRLLAVGCIIIALCRPQKHDARMHLQSEGTDIVLALDLSTSMTEIDLQPNRFEAARQIAANFVQHRQDDNLGLVGFGAESLTFTPLTQDVPTVISALKTLSPGMLGGQTALGDGLLNAVNRVLGGNAVSKSIILLTDGRNTAGEVTPLMAADVAKQKGVKVYTIGVGAEMDPRMASMLPTGAVSSDLDEETLQQISDMTGGQYFRATDNATLQKVFNEIDKLEKSKIESDNYVRWQDNFTPWIAAALLLLLIAYVCRYTLLRRIP
ncbi:MAG: VWA domain-containing protein [Muribaculaceae bacterium]|nr:VWA domain-containing protein [Muribaculaceae bacterium]